MFQSNSKLILVTSPTSASTSNQTLINNYIDLLTSRRVLEPVIEKQGKNISYEKLLSEIKAINQKDTAVIDVSVVTNNAKQSANIANEITDSFKSAVSGLYETSGLFVVDPAVESSAPSNVHKPVQLLIFTGIGFATSLISLFFVYDYTGGKIKKNSTKKISAKKAINKPKNSSLLKKLTNIYVHKMSTKITTNAKSTKQTPKKVINKSSPTSSKKTSTSKSKTTNTKKA
jgi:capsular polysaccharide biosynthesis protein